MLTKILVPLDGSPLAERALPYASRVARATGGQITLLQVVSPLGWDTKPPPERDLLPTLNALAGRLRGEGLAVELSLYNGYHTPPGNIIARAGSEHDTSLIVMSTHGRGGIGRFVYGSTADEVLRHAEVPLLLVPAASETPWPDDRPVRILVPLDGSVLAQEVFRQLGRLAEVMPCELLLLQVVQLPAYAQLFPADLLDEVRAELTKLGAELRSPWRSVEARAEVGPVAPTIARVAGEAHVDLIAMTTHGRGGLGRLLLGSVASATIQRAAVPLLLVRPAAWRDHTAQTASAPALTTAAPLVQVPLSAAELELVRHAIGKLSAPPESGWSQSAPLHELLAKLDRAQSELLAGSEGPS
jgi:nucleotide-binding universal stress UspA family protein